MDWWQRFISFSDRALILGVRRQTRSRVTISLNASSTLFAQKMG